MGGTQLTEDMECGTFNISEGRKELELGLRHNWTMPEQKGWRFSYEALTHVHSLRLFLFNSLISVPLRCESLRASLVPTSPLSSSPVVVCRWEMPEGPDSYIVYVPMPFCLIDHSVPFAVVARSDHIEVKIKLLPFDGTLSDDLSFLGFTHKEVVPIEMDGAVETNKPHKRDDKSKFSLTTDTELLTAKHVVSFYCRNCSAKLTGQLISRFQALPSTEWRDLADQWFGTCCCANAAQTKLQMAQFEQLLTPMKGVCLVGSTNCIMHCDDLASSVVHQSHPFPLEDEIHVSEIGETGDAIRQAEDDAVMSCCTTNVELPLSADVQSDVESLKLLNDPAVKRNGSYDEAMEQSLGLASCGSGCGHGHITVGGNSEEMPPNYVPKSLANGFMSESLDSCSSSKWTPFNCHACSSLIGVSTGEKEEGVQLFKCHISSDSYPGGPSDVFRHHSLERVFSNELLSSAEDNSSYRYIIRGLISKQALLQLVLINHDSWTCSGTCLGEQSFLTDLGSRGSRIGQEVSIFLGNETDNMVSCQDCESVIGRGNGELFPPIFLEPVMKVMFRDICSFNSEQLRCAVKTQF